jgi:hypothetical protein
LSKNEEDRRSTSPSPVEVGAVGARGEIRRRRDDAGLESRRQEAVVLVPGDRVLLLAGGEDVQVAVAVHVDDRGGVRDQRGGRDDARRERRRRAAVALEQGETTEHVQIAVLVEVRSLDRLAGEADHAGHPAVRPRVLVPDDLAVEARDGQGIVVAVAVEVGRPHVHAQAAVQGDRDRGEGLRVAGVVVPGDLLVVERRREEIDVGVAVHADREDRFGPVREVGEDVLHPGARRMAAVVLVPRDPAAVVGRVDVHVPVLVDVRRAHVEREQTVDRGVDEAFRRERGSGGHGRPGEKQSCDR